MFDKEFNLKIADFGCAAKTEESGLVSDPERATGGTRVYMAPERLKGDKYDGKKNDNFAAGIILFQMVAGKHPFECEEDKELEKDEFYEHIVDNRLNYFW